MYVQYICTIILRIYYICITYVCNIYVILLTSLYVIYILYIYIKKYNIDLTQVAFILGIVEELRNQETPKPKSTI